MKTTTVTLEEPKDRGRLIIKNESRTTYVICPVTDWPKNSSPKGLIIRPKEVFVGEEE